MSRRLGRRGSRVSTSNVGLYSRVLGLTAGRPFFMADRYNVDGGTSKVGSFIDLNDATHLLVQTTGANQVAVPSAHADFANTVCATFAGAEAYQSNRAAALWVMDHDGVSTEKWDIFTPTSAVATANLISTTVYAGGFPGSQLYYTGGADITHYLGDGVVTAGVGAATVNTPVYTSLRHESAAVADYELRRKGTLVSSGAFGAAVSGAAAQVPLTLGSNGFPVLAFAGNFRWKATFFTPALTAGQRATVQQWIQSTFGIAP